MRFRLLLLLAILLSSLAPVHACPWCKRYGIKETVSAGQPDPGGKLFGQPPPPDKTRHYYLAAEPVTWTWSPLGVNTSKPLPLPPYLEEQPTAPKVRYVQYTDATFTQRVLDTPRLGILGPVLRGMTGEYLSVTMLNRAPWPLSIHPHGVRYDKDNEGAYTEPDPGKGSAVGPGATFTYVWQLDTMSGPQPGEPSSKAWLYHSHCKDDEEINLGLLGFIVVTDPARARPDGTPIDVDREMPAMFVIFDETPEDEAIEYADSEKKMPPRPFVQTLELSELGARHSINGRLFGNLDGLEMREGERIRWYLGALGEENGLHTAHWHGARVLEEGRRVVDVVSLLPGETKVADQLADNPGTWLLHCHVSDHMMEGMFTNFVVRPKDAEAPPDAFLGSTTGASLQWTQAEINTSPIADADLHTELHGTMSIYTGFMPMRNPIKVHIGSRVVPLTFQDKANASGEGMHCEIVGVSDSGVLLGEAMQFKLSLNGTSWNGVLESAGLQRDKSDHVKIPLEIELGEVKHSSTLALKTTADGNWQLDTQP